MKGKDILEHVQNKKFNEAIELIDEELKIDKEDKYLISLKGYIFFLMGNKNEAQEILKGVIKKYPLYLEPWKYLGIIYMSGDLIEDASKALKICLNNRTYTPFVLKKLLSLSLCLRKFEESKKYGKMLLEIENVDSNRMMVAFSIFMSSEKKDNFLSNEVSLIEKYVQEKGVTTSYDIDTNYNEVFEKIKDKEGELNKNINEESGINCKINYINSFESEINKHNYEEAFNILKNYDRNKDLREFFIESIHNEWIYLFHKIMISLYEEEQCFLAAYFINIIFKIFQVHLFSKHDFIVYLLESDQFKTLYELLQVDVYKNPIFLECLTLGKKIIEKHGNFKKRENLYFCGCKIQHEKHQIFYKILDEWNLDLFFKFLFNKS